MIESSEIYRILVSVAISFAFGFYLGKKKIKYQEFLRASKEFRDAFIPALVELDPINDSKIIKERTSDNLASDIVKNHFEKQKKAVETFGNYLSHKKKEKLNKAWNEYAYPYHNQFPGYFDEVPNIRDYVTISLDDEPEVREKLRARINKIISFGKFK